MTTFNEGLHPRETTGRFAAKAATEADGGLEALAGQDVADELVRPIHNLPVERLDEALHRIDLANRRLARAGISDRFTYELEEYQSVRSSGVPGVPGLAQERVRLTLSAPSLEYGGHTFLAVVEAEDAGLVTRVHPDADLAGWRPDDMRCDHCGHTRARSKTYLVADPNGNRLQVGSTCLAPYLGVKPEGLWALGFDPVDGGPDENDGLLAGGDGDLARASRPVDFTVALAMAVSDDGKGFVSRGRANQTGTKATADLMEDALWGGRGVDPVWQDSVLAAARNTLESGAARKVLERIQAVEGDGDWATNLRTVAAGEWLKPANSALLASGLVAYRREIEEAEREKVRAALPRPAAGFAAPVGEKVKGMKAHVTKVRHLDAYDYHGYPITKTQVVLADEGGHEMVWWSSREQDVEVGAEVTLTGGRVKAHGQYDGVDQTVLTRVKFEPGS